ncbi:KAT8 regulatory NSL complex subunit 2 isoform X2 [Pectinophora gossypiella]|nr:KAT8 regulatory NSL complex subunit 2 isoform X2 [Pectinophora gossypiella]XP_049882728.1 KAT8 regulatory NSL complex subunit 2 isoform X2 [Pectinophora gossypiella]
MSNPPRKVIHLPKVRMVSRGARSGTGLRITNVKSIKPPDPDALRKQEEDKLRAQLQKEIVSRSRSCAYKRYKCALQVVNGSEYCARHILQDPNAPYRRCAHDKCSLPARADNADHQLCFEHARAALMSRQRGAAPPPPVTTSETLLHQLQHYVKPERVRTTSCASSVSVVSDPADHEQISPHAVDPFKQIDATAVNAAYSSSIMECASASDSDGESVCVTSAEGGDEGSDPEDADCEELPLWRAGVFTAEEAVSEAGGALRSLQAAYVGQMARLRTLLRAARLDYLKTLKAEKEQYCSIYSQSLSGPLTVRERRQLRKLKAFASYRRKHGVDAVLARKLHHKRLKATTPCPRPPLAGRCTFAEGGVRCPQPALPAAKHCLKHVLCDTNQVLFVSCGDVRGGVPCREPAPRLPLPLHCRYHAGPPAYTVFTLKKDGSDSDSDSGSSSGSEAEPGLGANAPPSVRA